jgi:RNA polymerase sigma factor (sigma-70 family)
VDTVQTVVRADGTGPVELAGSTGSAGCAGGPPPAELAEVGDAGELVELVAGAVNGDEAAWSALVRWFTPMVQRGLRRCRLTEADTADVLQVTWLRLVEQLPRIRDPRALVGWLTTTARREAYRVLSQAGRTVLVDDVDGAVPLGVPAESPEDAAERWDDVRQVRNAIARLPESDRRLLGELLVYPPPSYQAVAKTLGRPLGSIGPTRARCLRRLRRELSTLGVPA